MKKFTSTLFMLMACLYLSAQPGTLDATFNASGTPGYTIDNLTGVAGTGDFGQAIAVQSDGKIIVAGYTSTQFFAVARYTTAGVLDGSFGTGGVVTARVVGGDAAQAYAVAIQNDGKIVVAGWSWPTNKDFCVMRFNSDGSFDGSFGSGGKVVTDLGAGDDEARGVAIQSDGKIVVTGLSSNGSNNDFAVVRYSSAGVLDGSFGTGGIVKTDINGSDVPEGIVINNSNGTITIAGTSNSLGNGDFSVVRYTSAGVPDGTFGASGVATTDIGTNTNDIAHALALQSDGKVVVVGTTPNGANKDVALVRYTTTGGIDGSFSGGIVTTNYGVVNTDDEGRSVALQSDGKIVVGGGTDGAGSSFGFMVLRYSSAGVLDGTFDGDGKAAADLTGNAEVGYAVKLSGSRIYLAGFSGSPADFALAAFQNDGTPLPLVLSQFYAQKQTSKVVLQWQTTNEEDLKQFVIERSNDGKTYKAIGTVAAIGNSNTTRNYNFADQSPFMSANNYYRLVMQDVDGNYKYSKILIIKFDGQLTTSMQVFPSPVKDVLQIQLPSGLNGNVTLQIIDMNGTVVKKGIQASDGSSVATTMDVSTLLKGVYILKAQVGSTSVISRFTKN